MGVFRTMARTRRCPAGRRTILLQPPGWDRRAARLWERRRSVSVRPCKCCIAKRSSLEPLLQLEPPSAESMPSPSPSVFTGSSPFPDTGAAPLCVELNCSCTESKVCPRSEKSLGSLLAAEGACSPGELQPLVQPSATGPGRRQAAVNVGSVASKLSSVRLVNSGVAGPSTGSERKDAGSTAASGSQATDAAAGMAGDAVSGASSSAAAAVPDSHSSVGDTAVAVDDDDDEEEQEELRLRGKLVACCGLERWNTAGTLLLSRSRIAATEAAVQPPFATHPVTAWGELTIMGLDTAREGGSSDRDFNPACRGKPDTDLDNAWGGVRDGGFDTAWVTGPPAVLDPGKAARARL